MRSDFLKERLFGLANPQGNHGESIKEAHFHVDNTPVSSCCVPQIYVVANLKPFRLCETSSCWCSVVAY